MSKILSIIVTVYNGEKFLPILFKSLNYDNNDIEIIFIDDGSNDMSLSLINNFIKDKDNMFVYNKENGGSSTARNYGIKKAKGKYILFADCDDYYKENAIDIILDKLKSNDDLYVFDFNKVIDNETMDSWIKLPQEKYYQIEKNNVVEEYFNGKLNDIIGPFIWNKVYKRNIILKNNILFPEGKKLSEDVFFNIDYIMNSNKICIINERLYNYVIHKKSITRRYKSWLLDELKDNYKLVPKISKKYNCKDYDKYIMKIIIPFTLTLIKNETHNDFWDGLIRLKRFFSSKKTLKYLKSLDKSILTKKEFIYYILINTKIYLLVYAIYFLKNKLKVVKGE